MNADKNTALYEKMAAEQDQYRSWLKSQPPEEILNHTFEYTVREDIVMAMEDLELTDAQAQALLDSPTPLADVYRYFEKEETEYIDVVRQCIEEQTDDICRFNMKLLKTPVYPHSAAYAREHGELEQYRASQRANIACKDAIEAAISEHYRDNRLSKAAVGQVAEQFGFDRMFYVLANTVQQKDWDGRFSRDNKAWAKTVDIPPNPDGFGGERNWEFVVDSHPGLTDLFLTLAKREYLLTQPLTPEDTHAEASRLLQELRAPDTPNSPNGTHYMAQFSEDFMRRANSKDMDQVMAALPFRSVTFSGLNDRKGHFSLISKDEDRSKELRSPRRSVRRQLKQEPRPTEKKPSTRKKKEPER